MIPLSKNIEFVARLRPNVTLEKPSKKSEQPKAQSACLITSEYPSNALLYSSEPILSAIAEETFKTKGDLFDYSHTLMKKTDIYEFSKVYKSSTEFYLNQ